MTDKNSRTKMSEQEDITNNSIAAKQLFISSVISMSWQMAVAVLVPVVGGYYLDRHFNSAPWITLFGLMLGVILCVMIVRRAVHNIPGFVKGGKSK